MELIDYVVKNDVPTIFIKGHIDSANSQELENEIDEAISQNNLNEVVIDASELVYMSSAGLRVLLRLMKNKHLAKIINVSNEVYDVFEMTGFTEMMDIQKAYRNISVDGCEVIGQGANGKVYRIDRDTIVKVYLNPDSLPDIKRERELARTAFVLGIPTAIPYDVVKIGEGYGSVFELLNAKSFAKIVAEDPSEVDNVVDMSVDLLKKIHSTTVKEGTMPDMRLVAIDWVKFLEQYLPSETYTKLLSMVEAVPHDDHMMHGDYHLKNVMLQNGEALLIDMDTLCVGHPVFEFASIFNAYRGYNELHLEGIKDFLGIDAEVAYEIWNKTLDKYFDDKTKEEREAIADKAKIIGYTRMMRRTIRRDGFNNEVGSKDIEHAKNRIIELVAKYDDLLF